MSHLDRKPNPNDPREVAAGAAVEVALAADELVRYLRRMVMPTLGVVTAKELASRLAFYDVRAMELSAAWDAVDREEEIARNGAEPFDAEAVADRAAEVNFDDVEPF